MVTQLRQVSFRRGKGPVNPLPAAVGGGAGAAALLVALLWDPGPHPSTHSSVDKLGRRINLWAEMCSEWALPGSCKPEVPFTPNPSLSPQPVSWHWGLRRREGGARSVQARVGGVWSPRHGLTLRNCVGLWSLGHRLTPVICRASWGLALP